MTGISAFAATFRRAFHLFAIGVLALSAATLGVIIAPRVVGYETLVVLGSSMGKAYPVGSLVAVHPRPADDIAVGDVILMRTPGTEAVLHRVIQKHEEGDHFLVQTKGDANLSPDPGDFVLPNQVLVASVRVPKLGFLISWVHTPTGWLLLQGLPATLLAVWMILQLWWEEEWRSRKQTRSQYA